MREDQNAQFCLIVATAILPRSPAYRVRPRTELIIDTSAKQDKQEKIKHLTEF